MTPMTARRLLDIVSTYGARCDAVGDDVRALLSEVELLSTDLAECYRLLDKYATDKRAAELLTAHKAPGWNGAGCPASKRANETGGAG